MIEFMKLFDNGCQDNKDIIKDGYCLLPHAPNLQVVTQISATDYEKHECKDKIMAFIPSFENPKNHMDDIDIHISPEINVAYSLNNVRLLRKMLQPLSSTHCLVFRQDETEDYKVIGICSLEKIVQNYTCYVFTIKSRMKWLLRICNADVFGYKNGTFMNVSEIENEIDVDDVVNKIKKSIPSCNTIFFKTLLNLLIKEKHGTSFVIFKTPKKATNEAKRMASQKVGRGFLLSPVMLFNENAITQITDIDGGLILDSEARCYAYGCIFDGKVSKRFEGNPGRGSRYNSIKLYVENTKSCVGVIYSDDGTIDVVTP